MKCSIVKPSPFALLLALGCGSAQADTISAEFQFTGKPPESAVVYVEGAVSKGVAGVVDQKNKEFTTPVVVGTPNSSLSFKNSDDVDHNIYANDAESGVNFDAGLISPNGASSMKMDWKDGTLVRIGCKIHPKMKGYIANIPSEHFAVVDLGTSLQGSVADVPAGDGSVVVLLPKYDAVRATVAAGETKELPLMKGGEQKGVVKLHRQ